MANYWCVNFDGESQLKHGLRNKLWLMQYQYEDDKGNRHQGGHQKSATTRNWRQMKNVAVGDTLVAFLNGGRFFAIGTVIKPRRSKTPADHSGDIEDYVSRKRSHDIRRGRVFYTNVFYENFDDKWRNKRDPLARYAQRIEVDCWAPLVPKGVSIPGLLAGSGDFAEIEPIPVNDIQLACFPLSVSQFEIIASRLRAGERAQNPPRKEHDLATEIQEIQNGNDSPTVKARLIEARLGQGLFRKQVLKLWRACCAVTGVSTVEAIRASHIQPWRESDNADRLDPNNGIPLVATLDALFDRGLISFDSMGMMLISNRLDKAECELLGLIETKPIDMQNRDKMASFMARHRKANGFE